MDSIWWRPIQICSVEIKLRDTCLIRLRIRAKIYKIISFALLVTFLFILYRTFIAQKEFFMEVYCSLHWIDLAGSISQPSLQLRQAVQILTKPCCSVADILTFTFGSLGATLVFCILSFCSFFHLHYTLNVTFDDWKFTCMQWMSTVAAMFKREATYMMARFQNIVCHCALWPWPCFILVEHFPWLTPRLWPHSTNQDNGLDFARR